MSAIRYAAIFAEDLNLSDAQRENLGYTDGIAAIAEMIGATLDTQLTIADDVSWSFWPVPGAEAAADYVNRATPDTPRHVIIARAVKAALMAGFTEGLPG